MSSTIAPLPPSASPVAASARLNHESAAADHRKDSTAKANQDARAQLNAGIVEASLKISIKSGNEPQALLFRSAIDRLNEMLAPELGENAIQNAMSQDNSPEATAERIVSLSTGMFEAFKGQHAEESEAAVLEKFMATIRSGFEQGFRDAQGILKGLGVLKGDIAAGIDRTYELVIKGYADFEAGWSQTSADVIQNGFIA